MGVDVVRIFGYGGKVEWNGKNEDVEQLACAHEKNVCI